MLTDVPTPPLDGEKLLIVGADPLVTVKFDALVAVPDGVVTVILPVVAPAGTVVVIRPSFATLKLADVPLNRTLVAPVRLVPLMVTAVPGAPLDGEKLLIVGFANNTKSVRLTPTPSDVVARILPVVAPIGTVAVRCWSSATLNVVATLLNDTADTPATPPVNPLPVTDTSVPGVPLDGLNPVIPGGVAASAGVTAMANANVTDANETTAPRTNARTRVFTFMPSRPDASSRHHEIGRVGNARAERTGRD
jgi:hypothetical protein